MQKKDNTIKRIEKRYFSPVPTKARKIGDAILYTSLSFQPIIIGLPLPDNQKLWVNFGISALGIIGKIITNFAK